MRIQLTDNPADTAGDSEVEGEYDDAYSDFEQDFSLARSGGKNLTISSAVPDVVELENSMQSFFTACVFANMHPQS